jgi:Ca-activated chloride channel homolog
MRGLAEQGAGNFYFLEDAAAAAEVFQQELDFFVAPIALEVRVEAEAGAGWSFGEAIGARTWQGDGRHGSMKLPAVFVASRTSNDPDPETGGRRGGGSMLYVRLVPVGDGNGAIASFTLRYRLPDSGEVITETVSLAYPHAPSETPASTYLSAPEMAKRYAMYNVFLGLRLATRSYDAGCAAAALRATREGAVAWNAERADPDLDADVELIDLYLANLAAHDSAAIAAETALDSCPGADDPYGDDAGWGYGHDHHHGGLYHCAAGGSPSALVVIALAGVLGVRRRRHARSA